MHRAAGANLGVWFGCALPDDFGDWQREYWFAKKDVALVDASYKTYVSFAGPDRTRYLNAILTNNIKDLHPGSGNLSLLLNPQGRILAEIETHARPDTLFCISHAMIAKQLVETLDKFIIMDDVALADETQRYGTLSMVGPGAAKTVTEVVGVDLASIPHLSSVSANVGSVACTITRMTFGTHAVADILASHDDLKTIWQFLLEKTRSAGAAQSATKRGTRCASSKPSRGSATTSAKNKSPTKLACKTATSVTQKAATPVRKSSSASVRAAKSIAAAFF